MCVVLIASLAMHLHRMQTTADMASASIAGLCRPDQPISSSCQMCQLAHSGSGHNGEIRLYHAV